MKSHEERLPIIDVCVESNNGVWPFDEDVATIEKFDCGMMFKVPVFTRDEFEQRAKELGYVNECNPKDQSSQSESNKWLVSDSESPTHLEIKASCNIDRIQEMTLDELKAVRSHVNAEIEKREIGEMR